MNTPTKQRLINWAARELWKHDNSSEDIFNTVAYGLGVDSDKAFSLVMKVAEKMRDRDYKKANVRV